MEFDYKTLKDLITEFDFTIPDIGMRLQKITEVYEHYSTNEPVNGSNDDKDNWFKCMSLLQSSMLQLKAILNIKHPDDTSRFEEIDDGLPKYEIPDYTIIDEYKDDVFDSALDNNKGENTASWIKQFLSDYFYIPNAEIQIPIITAFTLMNSLAAPPNDKYPKLWVWGESGTGKTRLSEFIKYFYGGEDSRRVSYIFGTQSTAAGIRNTIDVVGKQNTATLFHWENVTPTDILKKTAEAYTMLLTNTRAKANKGNLIGTKEAGVQEFKMHTLWVLDSTQCWSASGKEGEVRRRCIIIKTEKSDKTYPELSNWSWKNAPQKHADLWTKEKIEKGFYPILIQAKKLSSNEGFPFKASEYEPYYQLIATGVHTGVWKDITEAIDCCIKHKELHESKRVEGMPLKVIIETIIQRKVARHKKDFEQWGDEPIPANNAKRISVSNPVYGLKREIETIRGSISAHELETKVSEVMNNLGYRYEVDLRENEQFYVRDTLD